MYANNPGAHRALHSVAILAARGLAATLLLLAAVTSQAAPNTWTSIGPYGASATVVTVDPVDSSVVYAGTGMGIYKSTNAGESWSAMGGPGSTVSSVVIDPSNRTVLYAAMGGEVYKSTDAGANWTKASTGISSPSVRMLVIDPLVPSTLYAGTAFAGVFKSVNGGANWVASNTGLTVLGITGMAIDPRNPAIVYASTFSDWGTFKSVDGGATWAVTGISVGRDAGFRNTFVLSLAMNPANPDILYVGTQGSGVWQTIDGGGRWFSVAGSASIVGALAVDPRTPITLYAATGQGLQLQ